MWGIVTLGVGCFLIVVLGSALGFLILTKQAAEQAKTTPSTVLLNPPTSSNQSFVSPPNFTSGVQEPQPPAFRPEEPPAQFKFPPPPQQFKDNSALVEKQEPEQKKPPKSIDESGYSLIEKEVIFKPKNECFTMLLPAGEKVRTSFKLIDVGNHRTPVESGSSETGTNTKSAASIIHGGTVLMRLSELELSDLIAEEMYKNREGKLKGKKEIKQDTVGGREYLIEIPEGALRLQVYVIAGITIMAAVEDVDMDKVRSEDADKFLQGLKFTDSTKKLYKDSRRK